MNKQEEENNEKIKDNIEINLNNFLENSDFSNKTGIKIDDTEEKKNKRKYLHQTQNDANVHYFKTNLEIKKTKLINFYKDEIWKIVNKINENKFVIFFNNIFEKVDKTQI